MALSALLWKSLRRAQSITARLTVSTHPGLTGVIARCPAEVVSKLVDALSQCLQVTVASTVLGHCLIPNLATLRNAHEIACISGDHTTLLLATVWIALPRAVEVCNSATFRLWFSQMLVACNAHRVLKLSLATHTAAHKIVSFLIMIVQLISASLPSIVLQNVILVSAQEIEMLPHPHRAAVRRALLWLIGFLARFETVM